MYDSREENESRSVVRLANAQSGKKKKNLCSRAGSHLVPARLDMFHPA